MLFQSGKQKRSQENKNAQHLDLTPPAPELISGEAATLSADMCMVYGCCHLHSVSPPGTQGTVVLLVHRKYSVELLM